MKLQQKRQLAVAFPELSTALLGDTSSENFEKLVSNISMIKGDRGDKGDTGERGEKGDKGDSGLNGRDGLKGEKGDKGDRGRDGRDGKDGKDGKDGRNGKDGKDAVYDDTAFKELDKKVLDGMSKVEGRIKLIDQRWHGGGITRVSHDTTLTGSGTAADPLSLNPLYVGMIQEIPTGTINGVNTSFTVTHTPKEIIIDGLTKIENYGYTMSGLTVNVDPLNPPVFFIISHY